MAETFVEEAQNLESTTVYLWRNSKVVKGGRRFSLSALVVVGDRQGSVGIGYGKATGAPNAIEKAQKNARKHLFKVTLKGGTIPHPVLGKYCASEVKLIPAAPGTGVIAGGTVRAVLEMAGVHDCLTKAFGSTNQKNLCKATIEGLLQLRSKEEVAKGRDIEIETSVVEELLEAGSRFAPQSSQGEKARGPVNKVGQKNAGGRGRGGSRGGRGGRGGQDQQAAPAEQASANTSGESTTAGDVPADKAPAAE